MGNRGSFYNKLYATQSEIRTAAKRIAALQARVDTLSGANYRVGCNELTMASYYLVEYLAYDTATDAANAAWRKMEICIKSTSDLCAVATFG